MEKWNRVLAGYGSPIQVQACQLRVNDGQIKQHFHPHIIFSFACIQIFLLHQHGHTLKLDIVLIKQMAGDWSRTELLHAGKHVIHSVPSLMFPRFRSAAFPFPRQLVHHSCLFPDPASPFFFPRVLLSLNLSSDMFKEFWLPLLITSLFCSATFLTVSGHLV